MTLKQLDKSELGRLTAEEGVHIIQFVYGEVVVKGTTSSKHETKKDSTNCQAIGNVWVTSCCISSYIYS